MGFTGPRLGSHLGRGIGMAGLQVQVAMLRGAISVESFPGRGTSWRITIPPPLALV